MEEAAGYRVFGDDLLLAPARDLLAVLDDGQVSTRELVDGYLARIDRLNEGLNAVVTLDAARARAEADASDERRARGEPRGVLEGLPVTIKDAFETAGMRTTSGAVELADHVPHSDAVAVARLRSAGAVLLGKTNLPRYADGAQTVNDLFGTTNNPWDLSRTPGGSSGGAAAAIAAGLSALELGSDIGGSIRHPADWCGIYGHKPTFGLVPMLGHIPPPPGAVAAAAIRLDLPEARVGDLNECRIAAWVDDPACPVDSAVRSQIEAMLGLAERAGATVVTDPILPIGMQELYDVGLRLLAGALARGVPETSYAALSEVTAADPAGSAILARYARAVTQSHRDWLAAHGRRERLRQQMDEFFEHYDVLVTANSPVQAMPHDHTGNELDMTITVNGRPRPWIDLLPWTALANIAYLPATTVPTGLGPTALPVGCQVIGREYTDRTTIAVAGLLGELTGGYQVPPGAADPIPPR